MRDGVVEAPLYPPCRPHHLACPCNTSIFAATKKAGKALILWSVQHAEAHSLQSTTRAKPHHLQVGPRTTRVPLLRRGSSSSLLLDAPLLATAAAGPAAGPSDAGCTSKMLWAGLYRYELTCRWTPYGRDIQTHRCRWVQYKRDIDTEKGKGSAAGSSGAARIGAFQ